MENEKAKYDVCIIGGLGHVGLPLGISFAAAGKRVALYDINKKAVETVSRGEMPFIEHGAEALLKKTLDETLFIFHLLRGLRHLAKPLRHSGHRDARRRAFKSEVHHLQEVPR